MFLINHAFSILLILSLFSCALVSAENSVPIQAEFLNKIVYTTDAAFDQNLLKDDCKQRGGIFNECGSVCNAQLEGVACIAVCAFTCELNQKTKNKTKGNTHHNTNP